MRDKWSPEDDRGSTADAAEQKVEQWSVDKWGAFSVNGSVQPPPDAAWLGIWACAGSNASPWGISITANITINRNKAFAIVPV